MYKICRSEQSFLRQRNLEKGLLQLMLKHNYEDISVSDLCGYMQIPRKSFYRYFSSKDGALYALIDHTLTDFYEMPMPKNKARGTAVGELDLFFVFWYERKDLLDALQRSSLSGILVERANMFALQEGLLPRKFKTLRPDVREIAMTFSISGLMSMVFSWHRSNFSLSTDEITQLAVNILTNPLLIR